MQKRLTLLLLLLAFSLSATYAVSNSEDLMRPLGAPGRYTFAPNQLAGAEWYKPAGRLINGHVEESFGNEKNSPELHRFLQETKGAFGVNAAEIGYLTGDWLLELRRAGIRLSAETPAWTQCFSGKELARTEIFGSPIAGRNLFESTFHIHVGSGQSDPAGHGWFFTKDGKDYAPDEIALDHRILFLLPHFDNDVLLAAKPGLSWQARKNAARRDPCPVADGFHHPPVDRLTGALLDYVDYADVVAQKFPTKPAFSFHWNVNPGWEWSDEQCLDALHELHPDAASFEKAFRYVEKPCHRDTAILDRLVEMLCSAGTCPATVFMDMELTYKQPIRSMSCGETERCCASMEWLSAWTSPTNAMNNWPASRLSAKGGMRLKQENMNDAKLENVRDQE